MKIFITGLNGFVAHQLAIWLVERGHEVSGTSRSAGGRFRAIAWRLGEPINPIVFTGVEVVIHLAHDFTPGAMTTNVHGTLALERAAAAASVRRQILVSSLSARPEAVSEYGRTKLAQEEYFLRRGHTVMRPGTVLGPGGLFGRIAGLLQALPVVPLLDGGRTRMTVIGVYDLCRAVEAILRRSEPAQYNLYYKEMPTFGEVLRLLRRVLRRRVVFLPVPATLLLWPLSVLRHLHVRTPVDVDNLKGYITNLAPYHSTNLAEVLPRTSTLEASLAESWGKPNGS
jgi:nucleoside-diphosphate-sugar epimerase